MYYHVIIYPAYGPGHLGGFIPNLEWDQLEERIWTPYRQGGSITFSGATIPSEEIARITILETTGVVEDRAFKRVRTDADPFRAYNDRELSDLSLLLGEMGQDITDDLITGAPGYDQEVAPHSREEATPAADAAEVFVVHGRNEAAMRALFDFLRAIELRPREFGAALASTGKGAPYIGQGLDAAFSRAHAVVVLVTPDDEARLRGPFRRDDDPPQEAELTGQARPNVLFEAGMAMGRNPERTVFVELGQLRRFSDVAGRHVIRVGSGSEWRHALAKRLEATGCPVNLDDSAWLTAGDFAAVLKAVEALSEHAENTSREAEHSTVVKLSDEAKELLRYAAEDQDGAIHRISTSRGVRIRVRAKPFNEPGDPRSEALWEDILDELTRAGLINDRKSERTYFQVTSEGFRVADNLRDAS